MPSPMEFTQECPTCGIHVTIDSRYAGRRVVCQHCHARFIADDPLHPDEIHAGDRLMRRVDRLLELAGHAPGSE